MIITRLIGGLGNQMFQYAVGRTLSFKWHTDLYLDICLLNNPPPNITPRYFELNTFNIKASIAPTDILKQVPLSRKDKLRTGFHSIFNRESIFQCVNEQTIDFDNRIPDLPDNIYLNGYWQSEKYFADIPDVIREDFTILPPPSKSNQEMLDKIQECNAVSIHIRRGDYLTNPETRRTHFVCDEDYYFRAIEIIMQQIEKPHFFVFSDDATWARNHIIPDAPVVYISHNTGKKSYEDLRLMMHCKHHVIANSSFSWWGAWLGKKEGQIVLVPGKWFNTKHCNYDDRVPKNWLVMK
jgi:hypothetical protein